MSCEMATKARYLTKELTLGRLVYARLLSVDSTRSRSLSEQSFITF